MRPASASFGNSTRFTPFDSRTTSVRISWLEPGRLACPTTVAGVPRAGSTSIEIAATSDRPTFASTAMVRSSAASNLACAPGSAAGTDSSARIGAPLNRAAVSSRSRSGVKPARAERKI